MKKLAALMLVVIAVVIVSVKFGLQSESQLPPRKTRLAFPLFPSSAIPILAYETGIFQANGLDVEIQTPWTGKISLDLMQRGLVDFAAAYDTPTVMSILEGNDIRILSTLHNANENTVFVYRNDSHIRKPKDIEGHSVAFVPGTNAEFLMEIIIRTHALDRNKIRFVPATTENIEDILKSGSADSAILWEPMVSRFVNGQDLDFGMIMQPFYAEVSMMLTSRQMTLEHPRRVDLMAKSLGEAFEFMRRDRKRAIEIVSQFLRKRGVEVPPEAWSKLYFSFGFGDLLDAILAEELSWFSKQRHLNAEIDLSQYYYRKPVQHYMPQWVATP